MAAKRAKRNTADRMPGILRRHPRQLIAIVVGVAVWFLVPASETTTGLLIAWTAGAWLFIALVLKMMTGADIAEIRRRAGVEDEGRMRFSSRRLPRRSPRLSRIVLQMSAAQEMHGAERVFSTVLALFTIFGSWLVVHFIFALHYAHEYLRAGP